MTHAFASIVRQVIAREGGATVTNDPDDRGGLTKYGISHRSYPGLDIRNLSEAQAIEIYRRDYWQPLRLDEIQHTGIAAAIFDTGVNMGTGTAARLAQSLAGVPVDGIIGPVSVRAINGAEPSLYLAMFVLSRIERHSQICTRDPSQRKYLHGWVKRCLDLLV